MFSLQRAKNWTRSSVSDDKKELTIYQSFQDQFSSIKNKADEYIRECSYFDSRLFIDYNGKQVSIDFISSLKNTISLEKSLSVEERAIKVAELTRFYNQKLKEIEERIISLSLVQQDNVYLSYIASCIKIINSLLKEYGYLLAVQKSGVQNINSIGEPAGVKLKKLQDEIELRITEINSRLTIENIRK